MKARVVGFEATVGYTVRLLQSRKEAVVTADSVFPFTTKQQKKQRRKTQQKELHQQLRDRTLSAQGLKVMPKEMYRFIISLRLANVQHVLAFMYSRPEMGLTDSEKKAARNA